MTSPQQRVKTGANVKRLLLQENPSLRGRPELDELARAVDASDAIFSLLDRFDHEQPGASDKHSDLMERSLAACIRIADLFDALGIDSGTAMRETREAEC